MVVVEDGGRGTDEELSPDLAGRPGSVSSDRRGHNALNQWERPWCQTQIRLQIQKHKTHNHWERFWKYLVIESTISTLEKLKALLLFLFILALGYKTQFKLPMLYYNSYRPYVLDHILNLTS